MGINKKNCAFQYATGDARVYKDTGLITKDEAETLWNEFFPKFIQHVEEGKNPEICIWTNMENDTDYHTDEKHLIGDECILCNGILYVVYK